MNEHHPLKWQLSRLFHPSQHLPISSESSTEPSVDESHRPKGWQKRRSLSPPPPSAIACPPTTPHPQTRSSLPSTASPPSKAPLPPTLARPTPERLPGSGTEHTTSTDGPTKGSGGRRYLPSPLHTKCSWGANAVTPPQLVETAGTALMVLIGGELSATVVGYETAQIGAYIGISTALLLTTFIYATAPASGGHLNPLVSLATMCTGLCPVPRGEFYLQAVRGLGLVG